MCGMTDSQDDMVEEVERPSHQVGVTVGDRIERSRINDSIDVVVSPVVSPDASPCLAFLDLPLGVELRAE